MEERWKEIKGYEGYYEISTEGKVKSLQRKYRTKEKILVPVKDNKGYLRVNLTKDGRQKRFRIHRLVAETFIPNPENKEQVNHKNGIKDDNRIENLEWATNGENQIHAIQKGLKTIKRGKEHYEFDKVHSNNKKVAQFDLEGNKIAEFVSMAQAGRSLGKGYTSISKVCRGENQTAYGYIWKFIE